MRSTNIAAAAIGLGSSMAATAAAASTLFSGATIVAFDSGSESLRIIDKGAILVEGDRIARIYDSVPGNGSVSGDVERIDVSGQIITPGFIDTHRHGWQTTFKTLGSNTSLAEYVGRYGEFAARPLFSADDVYLSQLAGLYEMINAGVTTSLDHAHHTWSDETSLAGAKASADSGARVFWAYALHEVPDYTVEQQLVNFRDIAAGDVFEGVPADLALAFDSWSTTEDENLLQEIVDTAKELNVSVLTTHSVYGAWGFNNLPSRLHELGILNTSIPVVISHGSLLPPVEAQLLRSTNQYISVTPESEMHYGHTHEESYYMMDQASLGVDTHFTFSTDILTQARIWLQKVRYHFYNKVVQGWRVPSDTPMTAAQAFHLATRAGGLALRRPDLGVIEEGAKADLVVWDAAGSPALLGWRDPVAAVLLHASVGDILHVTVDGKFVKRDGRLTAPGYADVRKRFQKSAHSLQDAFLAMPYPALEGKFLDGFDYAEPRKVDSQRGDGLGYEGPVFVDHE
jgi:cytosine/adenosine deaminase-related metal-dependent hydrolase